jgi:hypothetical protein
MLYAQKFVCIENTSPDSANLLAAAKKNKAAVTPVKTGVQEVRSAMKPLDSGFRRNDTKGTESIFSHFSFAKRGEGD